MTHACYAGEPPLRIRIALSAKCKKALGVIDEAHKLSNALTVILASTIPCALAELVVEVGCVSSRSIESWIAAVPRHCRRSPCR